MDSTAILKSKYADIKYATGKKRRIIKDETLHILDNKYGVIIKYTMPKESSPWLKTSSKKIYKNIWLIFLTKGKFFKFLQRTIFVHLIIIDKKRDKINDHFFNGKLHL